MRFGAASIWLGDEDVSEAIRTEEAGMNASRVSALPLVRTAGRSAAQLCQSLPGLVADGATWAPWSFQAPL